MGQGALVITIPKTWVEYYGLKAGDKVVVITNGQLKVRPIKQGKGKNQENT